MVTSRNGNSAYFVGNCSHVECIKEIDSCYYNNFELCKNGKFTVHLWIKTLATEEAKVTVMSTGSLKSYNGLNVQYEGLTTTPKVNARIQTNKAEWPIIRAPIVIGQMHLITITWSAEGKMELYVDGKLIDTSSKKDFNSPKELPRGKRYLASSESGLSLCSHMEIDDFQFIEGEVLSEDKVLEEYELNGKLLN